MSQETVVGEVPQDDKDINKNTLDESKESERDETLGQMEITGETSGGSPQSLDETLDALRRVREDVGQICELSSEEVKIVEAFAVALLKLMQPLVKTIPVNPSILPRELGDVERANIVPSGKLIVLHNDGQIMSINLSDVANRDLLVVVVRDVLPKFNELVAEHRAKIERRMGFLSSVTKELQNIAEAFSSAIT